jgi:hypothetical protein
MVQSQPGQIVCKTLSRKNSSHKKGLVEYHKKKKIQRYGLGFFLGWPAVILLSLPPV